MDSTADRRSAHLRVGAAALAAFLALLLLGALHRAPAGAPAATSTVQPTQPVPVEPRQADPDYPGRDFHHDHDGLGPRGFGGGGGAPAPSTGGGSQT